MTGAVLTSVTYVTLVVLWSTVCWLYLLRQRQMRRLDPLVATLLVVLVVDAFKNTVENVYFGLLWSTRFGFLPAWVGEPLEDPWALAVPKLLNVGVAAFVLLRVIGGFLPKNLAERQRKNAEEEQLRRELERSLALVQQSEGRLQSLLERTSDVVAFWIVVDQDLVLESVNKAGKAVLGFGDEAIGTTFRTLAPPSLQLLLARAWESGEPQREEDGWLDTRGGRRAVIRQVVPMPDEDGVIRRLASFTQDITALRERQAEEEGRARLESLGILAGGVAHDFNNLLAILRTDVDLAAARDVSAAERAEALAHADVTIERTRDLVTQLLAMAGKRAPVTGAVDLGAVVEDTARLLLPGVPAGVRLTTAVEPGATVIGDRTQLQQVVLNLMKNGLDAVSAPSSSPPTSAATGAPAARAGSLVHAALTVGDDVITLVVKDDGPGIDTAAQWRIFEPFFTTKRGGRGLGLATVFGLTRAHGGTVEVDSTPGQGAVFTVRLPRAVGVAPSPPAPAPAPEPTMPEPGPAPTPTPGEALAAPAPRSSFTVLLVDDDDRVRRATRRLLERLGHRVVAAASGAEALAVTEPFDLAVVDVTMPEMDGPTTLLRLRERRPGLPGILVTGRGIASDGDVVLPKPFDEAALARVLEQVMGAPRRAEPAPPAPASP
jgi:PAS domain S-box-containing protein